MTKIKQGNPMHIPAASAEKPTASPPARWANEIYKGYCSATKRKFIDSNKKKNFKLPIAMIMAAIKP
jgi:hypothetical protein